MLDEKYYYSAPSERIFKNIKKCAIEIWKTYDNEYGYVDEKVNRIKDLKNVEGRMGTVSNALFMVNMFDFNNKAKLFKKLSTEGKKWLAPILNDESIDILRILIKTGNLEN